MNLDSTLNEVSATRAVTHCENISAHEAFLLSRLKEPTPIGQLKSSYRDLFDFDATLDSLIQKGCVSLSRREESQTLYSVPLRGGQVRLISVDFGTQRAWIEVKSGDPMTKVLYRLNWRTGGVERIVGAGKPSLMSAVTFVFSPSVDSREQVTPSYRLGPDPIATSRNGIHRVYDRNPDILEAGMFYVSEISGMGPLKLEAEGVLGHQPVFNPDDSGCVAWIQTSPDFAVMVSEPFQSARKVLDLQGSASVCWKDSNTLVVLSHKTGEVRLVLRRGSVTRPLAICQGPQSSLWIDPIQRSVVTVGEDRIARWISLESGTTLGQVQLTTAPEAVVLREDGVMAALQQDGLSIIRFKGGRVSHLRERIHPSSFSAHMRWRPNQPLVLLKTDRNSADIIQIAI